MAIETRTRSKCKTEYPSTREYFYLHPKGKNGLQTWCKKCKNEHSKESRKNDKALLIRKFTALLKDKIRKEYLKCKQCNQLLPRIEDNFINPNSNSLCTCKQCTRENMTGTKREGYRVCKKCDKELPATLEYFYAEKSNIYGVRTICKECRNEETKEYAENNKDHLRGKAKEWRENNKDTIKKTLTIYRKTRSYKDRKNRYKNERKQNDPKYRLNHNISRGINKSLHGNKNGRHWESIVGYNCDQLMKHLEKQFKDGMTWKNQGEWHIDHKRPIASFNFEAPEDPEFKECWALDNLQPLWAEDNIRKSDKWEAS